MIAWCAKKEGRVCVHEHFESAFEDWKSHKGYCSFYPKWVSKVYFEGLEEFKGW